MEDTKEKNAVNPSLQKIQKMVEKVKEDKGVLLEYMKIWEREQMIREEGVEAGKAEQEKETEKERQRAEKERQRAQKEQQRAQKEQQRAQKEQQRAEKAEQEVAELRKKLEELQKQN